MPIGRNPSQLSSFNMVYVTLLTHGLFHMVMRLQLLSLPMKAMMSGLETTEAVKTVESMLVLIQMVTKLKGRIFGISLLLKWANTILRHRSILWKVKQVSRMWPMLAIRKVQLKCFMLCLISRLETTWKKTSTSSLLLHQWLSLILMDSFMMLSGSLHLK